MKKVFLLFLIFLILLFSGCVKIHINQKVYSNYDSDLEVKMDMSGMAGLMGDDQNTSFGDYCNNLKEDGLAQELADFKCEVDEENFIVKFSGTSSLKGTGILEIETGLLSTKYKFDVSKGQKILDSLGNSDVMPSTFDSTEEISEEQLQMLKSMGVEMVYTIEMPGTITKTDTGEIKGNKVEIDLMTLNGKENIYIESEETNYIPIIFAAVIIAIAVALGFIIKKRV